MFRHQRFGTSPSDSLVSLPSAERKLNVWQIHDRLYRLQKNCNSSKHKQVMDKMGEIIEKCGKNKRNKRTLRSTLKEKEMTRLVKDIKQYNEHCNPPREEINSLIKESDAAEREELVCRFCNRNILLYKFLFWFPLFRNKSWRKTRDYSVSGDNKQLLTAKHVRDTLYEVRRVLEILSNEDFEGGVDGEPMKRPFGVPEKPEFTVGMDAPLNKLKMEVLREGVSILVLTGLGGSGKTTLARKLCWDEEVKGKFRQNILFITFSQTPKLKNIVERVFEHCGYHVPEFQSDEDAIKRFGNLLRKFEGNPTLLVLDDVWPDSEALVEKFKFKISDYKILVTSRVAFPRFSTTCILKPLVHEDAIILFHRYAFVGKNSSSIREELVEKVVRCCKGLPLAIKVIGKSLSHRPYELWQKIVDELSQGHSILNSNTELLTSLKKLLDILEDNHIKECFMDLGLFPEDQRIPVAALVDIWAELYALDDDGIKTMDIIKKLDSMNLANLIVARKNTSDVDNNYNNHFIILHDLLRELAVHQSNQKPVEQRKRLVIDTNENKYGKKQQQGMIARRLSNCFKWFVKQNLPMVPARILSISTDETCTSYLSNMQPTQAEVLILNLQTKKFCFSAYMDKMTELKVLMVTSYNFYLSELENFKLLSSVPNLKRIRLERISVPPLGALKNLKKLSLYMCSNMSQAFENSTIPISNAFPNLVDLNIDYCKDMVELPAGVCDITPLEKLSITNCHKLKSLPKEIGKLENLEQLRLNSCTDLEGLPDSIGRLSKLRLIDISTCISLPSLPEDIGNLCNLRKLYMTSCSRCELPYSIINLENLETVICDEETAASWEAFEGLLPDLKIEVPHVEVNLNWLHSGSS